MPCPLQSKACVMFESLEDCNDPGFMNIPQIEKFANELGINPYTDIDMLYLLHAMNCKVMVR